MQFENREVNKVYHAVTWGAPPLDTVCGGAQYRNHQERQGPPAPTRASRPKRASRPSKPMPATPLVQAEPVTGRMHQIRLHLAYVQAPIVGDTLYGGEDFFLSSLKKKVQPQRRRNRAAFHQALRAARHGAGFHGPGWRKPFRIEAPYPKDFRVPVGHATAVSVGSRRFFTSNLLPNCPVYLRSSKNGA
ncbi:MAG: pseudouridine synthase [Hymenobacter sp.]